MPFNPISVEVILFLILYGITGVLPFLAAVYLLLRRGNAFALGVTPPVRLRRWVASFFGVAALAHVWWILFSFLSGDLNSVGYLVIVMLDCVLLYITLAGTLMAMLQDRSRPMWPVLVSMIPFVVLMGVYMVYRSPLLGQMVLGYLLLLSLLFTAFMVFAIRRYGRWLNDNYADLENKKVWLCQTVALGCMLLFVLYVFATDMVLLYIIHVLEIVLVGLLLWRVETLPQLENSSMESAFFASAPETVQDNIYPTQKRQPLTIPTNIEQLLDECCVGTQLYLQHDLSLLQLAQTVGINRFYLSQYFSRQGTTYNAYINDLRINHFMSLYREAAAAQQSITAQQLASDSGYRSYSTFSLAFKQRTGQSVKAWMRETIE